MAHPAFQFSLRQFLLAIPCFALAAAWAALVISWGAELGLTIALILFTPVTGTGLGGGIGVLYGRVGKGIMLGVGIQLAVAFVLVMLSFVFFSR